MAATPSRQAVIHVRIADISPRDPMGTGAEMRPVTGERLQLLHQRVPSGATLPPHQHDNEQLNFVLSGQLRIVVEGIAVVLRPNEVVVIQANAKHGIEALEDTIFLEVTAPPRPELADQPG